MTTEEKIANKIRSDISSKICRDISKKELGRLKKVTGASQRYHLRAAKHYLGDAVGYGRRTRLFYALCHCIAGFFCKSI